MAPNLEGTNPVHPHVATADSIPLFAGRPQRERVIGRDDLMDVDIILHTCNTVEELLAKI
ncbi:MAG TPA: hypothetical protein VHO02_00525 [Fibrobacteria bacterium]|jgi:hypothetical protein|nr:hypothetical protein [Fibrobacteria bacterium]